MTRQAQLRRSSTTATRRTGIVLCGLIVLTGALIGCGREARTTTAPNGLTQGEFVAVVVALRKAEREVAESLRAELPDADEETREDSAAVLFGERKREILEEHDTDEDEVRAFVLANGGDLRLLQTTWGAIEERSKYVRAAADEPLDAVSQEAKEREAARPRPGAEMRIIPDRKDLERIR